MFNQTYKATQDLEETNHPILDKMTLHISKQLDDVGIKLACRVDIAGSALASKTPTKLPSRQQNHFVGDVVPSSGPNVWKLAFALLFLIN